MKHYIWSWSLQGHENCYSSEGQGGRNYSVMDSHSPNLTEWGALNLTDSSNFAAIVNRALYLLSSLLFLTNNAAPLYLQVNRFDHGHCLMFFFFLFLLYLSWFVKIKKNTANLKTSNNPKAIKTWNLFQEYSWWCSQHSPIPIMLI